MACAQVRIGTGTVDTLYKANCATCHGQNLEGGQGSSLVDAYWTHGDSDEAIAQSIAEGFPDMGMIPWKNALTEEQIRSLVIYIREQGQLAQAGRTKARVEPLGGVFASDLHHFTLEKIVEIDDILWSMAFMPDGAILLAERDGPLWRYADGVKHRVEETPAVWQHGQGGLMEVALHPDYTQNGWIYLGFSENTGAMDDGKEAGMTAVVRGRIKDDRWVDQEEIFRVPEEFHIASGVHFGTRFVFRDGYLFFSIGERGRQEMAQDLTRPNGKIHRIHDDGRIPSDNPFVNEPGAFKSIWSYGHRNPQGLDLDPRTGELWETEHGPRGGDETNLIRPGLNYGWPVITYGMNYDGTPITDLTAKKGMEQPMHHWTPSIAVCGIDFYEGDLFPRWKNNLLVTGLASEELHRLVIEDNKVVKDEVILKGQGRVRDVLSGPDGHIYLALNSRGPNRGGLFRLNPVAESNNWRSLFDGETLDGWTVRDGTSTVLVDDGMMVAVHQGTTGHTYLVTEERFSDFILELDVKVIGDLNSGILLRGIADPAVKGGKVHGYQMEIDQSPRQWTGGIFEEMGRGWLYSLDGRDEARAAYRPSAWNHYRIEAIGDILRIWVNGVPTLNLKDDRTAEGVIGFQIHNLPKEGGGGAVFIRNVRILTENPVNQYRAIGIPVETAQVDAVN
ncbi:MAG: PQQ-dependent sugar dehydrogenase [Opitutaceae bacterium]